MFLIFNIINFIYSDNMKNYKNYINEYYSKDYEEVYPKNTLSYKLQKALDKPGDNDKEIRNLIGFDEHIDYKYEYQRSKYERDTDQLILIFEPDDTEYVAGLMGIDDKDLYEYEYLISDYNSPNEINTYDDIQYFLNNENKKIFENIFNIFNIKIDNIDNIDNIENEEIGSFFSLFEFSDDKIKEVGDEITNYIDIYIFNNKRKMANEIYFKLNFTINKDSYLKNHWFEFVFDLKKVKYAKNVKTLYEYFKLNDNIEKNFNFDEYEIDEEIETEYENDVKKELLELEKHIKKYKEDILNNINIKNHIGYIEELGGDILKKVTEYDFQKKYVGDDLEKLKYLISHNIINPKLKDEMDYLLNIEQFNI